MALRRVPRITSVQHSSVNKPEECAGTLIPEETITVNHIKTKKKHKGGRPKSKNKRRHQVKLSLDDATMAMLNKLKEESGKNASELFVDLLQGAKIKPVKAVSKEELDRYYYLAYHASRLGIAVNQFNKLKNIQSDSLCGQLQAATAKIQQELNQLKKRL